MTRALLTLVLLPLLLCACTPLVRALSGEFCHGWSDPLGARHRGFRCPERADGAGARYCCGSCALRYCCASAGARLDQSTCEHEREQSESPAQPSIPTYLPFVIVVSAFLSFVLLGTIVSVCCCHCLKPKASDRPGGSGPAQTALLDSAGPSPKSSTPSRASSAGSHPPAPPPSDLSVYGAAPAAFPPAPPLHQGAPQFYQPYLSYPLPPEHTMLMAPAFLDGRSVFGQPHGQPFPQAPMHTEPIYPTVTV